MSKRTVPNDTVFLLSIDEANALFSNDDARKCQATAYANAQRPYYFGNWWWLRSSGDRSDRTACVDTDGSISYGGSDVDHDDNIIRPVVVIRLY